MQPTATMPPGAGIVSVRATFPAKTTVIVGIGGEGIDMTTGTTRLTIRTTDAAGGRRLAHPFSGAIENLKPVTA